MPPCVVLGNSSSPCRRHVDPASRKLTRAISGRLRYRTRVSSLRKRRPPVIFMLAGSTFREPTVSSQEGLTTQSNERTSLHHSPRQREDAVEASVIFSICATVIAIASLAVAVYQARATRRHNRQSVRPILEQCRLQYRTQPRRKLPRILGATVAVGGYWCERGCPSQG